MPGLFIWRGDAQDDELRCVAASNVTHFIHRALMIVSVAPTFLRMAMLQPMARSSGEERYLKRRLDRKVRSVSDMI